LTWTLVILGIGALLIPPLLSFVNTNLGASRTIEEGLKEQYAADAGVEYALHRLANADCPDEPFAAPTLVNNMPVTVTVESEGDYYKITSTAKDTVICSYVEYSTGGNLDIYKGALVSAGDITLAQYCTVDGDIRFGGSFDPGKNFTQLSGDQIQGEIKFPSSDEFAQTYKDEAMACGAPCIHDGNLIIAPDSQKYLGPKYITGDLEVGMNSVITLTGTIYVAGIEGHMPSYDIKAEKDSVFTGEGSIVAVGNIYMQKVSDFGAGTDTVIMSVTGDITFKKDADVKALIYAPGPAPNGNIKFDKEGIVTGGVVGAKIQADRLNLFAYDASFYDGFRLPGYEDPGFRVLTYHIYP
jgi:hypothetical protein